MTCCPLSHDITLHYITLHSHCCNQVQHAKKVVSNSPGLVDFAIRLVISVPNLPEGTSDVFWGIHEQQAVKLVFFAPFGLLIFYIMMYRWLPYLGSDFVRRIGLLMLLLLFFLLKLIPAKKVSEFK